LISRRRICSTSAANVGRLVKGKEQDSVTSQVLGDSPLNEADRLVCGIKHMLQTPDIVRIHTC
jgi:hypothetical protein